MQAGKGAMHQQMNGDAKLEKEELIPESENVEEGAEIVLRSILALNVWRDGLQGENLQVKQMCYVPPSPSPDGTPAIPLPEHQLLVTRSQNPTGSSLSRQLVVTTMRISLTADSCHLTTASVETFSASLAEAQELMGNMPAGGVREEMFEWVSLFSFELFFSEGGIFPPSTEFLREDAALDVLPSFLCPSLNPLLHRLPPLASSLGQVERVLQLRRHRLEAVLLRRRLLLAVREGHVEDPPEIEESSTPTSQRKRKIIEHMRQDDSLERRKRSFTICVQEDVPLGESSKNVESVLQNPEEVKSELEKELGKLLNRHHSSCGWISRGDVREGEGCTGDSDDNMAHKTSEDGNISTKVTKKQKEYNSKDKDERFSGPSGSPAADRDQKSDDIGQQVGLHSTS